MPLVQCISTQQIRSDPQMGLRNPICATPRLDHLSLALSVVNQKKIRPVMSAWRHNRVHFPRAGHALHMFMLPVLMCLFMQYGSEDLKMMKQISTLFNEAQFPKRLNNETGLLLKQVELANEHLIHTYGTAVYENGLNAFMVFSTFASLIISIFYYRATPGIVAIVTASRSANSRIARFQIRCCQWSAFVFIILGVMRHSLEIESFSIIERGMMPASKIVSAAAFESSLNCTIDANGTDESLCGSIIEKLVGQRDAIVFYAILIVAACLPFTISTDHYKSTIMLTTDASEYAAEKRLDDDDDDDDEQNVECVVIEVKSTESH
ncbi:unnamed protein product [Caenorhabditis bovis]|uniref:Uncharacterized protein n=1 Tax=Caenorhabditis bovis TaxID=2654633 RepID=A0A8S1EUH2_9PELO|nr:unnamed protein product [Caenorhabditis bovis]